MLKRTMDAAFLNGVANHPEVRPWLGGAGALDLSATLADPANVGLESEHGGFVVIKLEAGLYECHSMFLPSGRGGQALEAAKEGIRYLFIETDCVELVTKCPDGNPAAAGLARAMGFSSVFRRDKIEHKSLSIQKWIQRDDQALRTGRQFHDDLENAKKAAGSLLPTHDDDQSHDRAVGAAVLMIRAGNAIKGVGIYNRWAKFAGYQTIGILSACPLIIDIRDAIILERYGDMEILKCQ